ARREATLMEGRCLTVGPVQENCWIVWNEGSERALVIDPGDEAERILATLAEHGLTVEAILLTHTHFDHVGAVAEVARATDPPGGAHATLLASIAMLLDRLPGETQVLPGHMGPTTLDRERATNPFLQELHA